MTTIEQPALPMRGPANREIVVTDIVRSGQPRPYADHERVERVTIYRYDWNGVLREETGNPDGLVADALAQLADRPYRVSAKLAEQLAANKYIRDEDIEVRDTASMSGYFASFIDSAHIIDDDDQTVEIVSITPFTD